MQERDRLFGFMKGQEEGERRRNNTFFYQACSLTDDIENREDSLHASKIYMYFTWLYVYKYMEIYMYIYTSIPGLGQCKPKHAKQWKHTTLVFLRTKTVFIMFYPIITRFFFS